ncbi:MAG: 50S ribosomal protein L10 [Candidatus Omnitrophica bacterium CG11_big_fil_rev_8_21_14_0_20_45_26]|uniref:Large ribosomal subunit protein uL10 n=1 Tax=Candidatus Abzuiibacterium crystallinum TaxID=1974748 RepID=A0A2H0LNI2_9BACT|nr:MAG: 50S ribosomal protein L10 [Candidatus Omnitrophica bacterium CG11_big_fil_rev_8_21_14_0_20_45_26]PIW63430.1 MAG: 50S ribosomal protein L10 [Candidatus Omnitrophica bacterium CG12_big_fil_rev_8_21_14_0_65_45_16]
MTKDDKITQEKELVFNHVMQLMDGKDYVFFAKFSGIGANDMNNLRRKLEKAADASVVVKHSIARLILERMNMKDAQAFLDGSVLLTTGHRDPQVVSKVLVEFAKEKENFELKGIFINKNVFQKQYIQDLAKLPSRQELLASVVGGMQAPIAGFVNGLGQVLRSFVNVLDQIQKQKS